MVAKTVEKPGFRKSELSSSSPIWSPGVLIAGTISPRAPMIGATTIDAINRRRFIARDNVRADWTIFDVPSANLLAGHNRTRCRGGREPLIVKESDKFRMCRLASEKPRGNIQRRLSPALTQRAISQQHDDFRRERHRIGGLGHRGANFFSTALKRRRRRDDRLTVCHRLNQ